MAEKTETERAEVSEKFLEIRQINNAKDLN